MKENIILKALMTSRKGNIPLEAQQEILNILENERKILTRTYPERLSTSFDMQILYYIQDDKRVKNYNWFYSRRDYKKVPLDKELQVLDAIKDKIFGEEKGNKK